MQFSKEEAHDLKNQLAIAMGMVEISLKYLSKTPIDISRITEKLDKAMIALKKINGFIESKKSSNQV
jgi:hypothetical protein